MIKIKVTEAVVAPCGRNGEVMKFSENGDWALVRFLGTDKSEWYNALSLKRLPKHRWSYIDADSDGSRDEARERRAFEDGGFDEREFF